LGFINKLDQFKFALSFINFIYSSFNSNNIEFLFKLAETIDVVQLHQNGSKIVSHTKEYNFIHLNGNSSGYGAMCQFILSLVLTLPIVHICFVYSQYSSRDNLLASFLSLFK